MVVFLYMNYHGLPSWGGWSFNEVGVGGSGFPTLKYKVNLQDENFTF